MILQLHFTEQEIIDYLIEAGYEISREMVEHQEHVHGSRFTHDWRWVSTASKGKHTGPIEEVFKQVIKDKLLKP